jgi:ZIP family zinc transporter
MAIVFALLMSAATALGGTLALRSRDRRHVILGLSAGLLLGMVTFDLLPEVFSIGAGDLLGTPLVSIALVTGFLSLHFVERAFGAHEPAESDYGHDHDHAAAGLLGAIALVIHVFLDGVAMGLAFNLDVAFGVVVTVAVFAHAFSDGLNTVSLLLHDDTNRKRAVQLLVLDGVARVSGALLGTVVVLDESVVALYLALFAGFLIYLATSHILPEAHAKHPSRSTMLATLAGVVLMFIISSIGHSALHGDDHGDEHAAAAGPIRLNHV